MACGVPVAAFPVNGPIDVIQDGVDRERWIMTWKRPRGEP